MLQAIPDGWLSRRFVVLRNGQPAAAMAPDPFASQADLNVEGQPYKAYRESGWGDFVLSCNSLILARANKDNCLLRAYALMCSGKAYSFYAASPFTREFVLLDGQSQIGSICPESPFSRQAIVDLPDAIPLPVQVFIFWLAMRTWK